MASANPVSKLYSSVIEDVIHSVREAFLDEGVDDQVLHELKQLWERKLQLSKAVDFGDEKEAHPSVAAQQAMLKQAQMAQAQMQPKPHPQQQAAVAQAQVAQVQLPAFNPATGQFDMSGAAAQAQTALGNLLPGSTVTIQMPQGPMQFLIQPQVTQQLQQHAQLQQQQQQQVSMTIPATVDQQQRVGQLDGANDSSSDDDDDDGDDDDDDDDDDDNKGDDGAEEEPLNSNDDVSDDESAELFETENVVVCQFDKIHRNKNRWKFYLKDGIMNLKGKDYVFQKSTGDAEW